MTEDQLKSILDILASYGFPMYKRKGFDSAEYMDSLNYDNYFHIKETEEILVCYHPDAKVIHRDLLAHIKLTFGNDIIIKYKDLGPFYELPMNNNKHEQIAIVLKIFEDYGIPLHQHRCKSLGWLTKDGIDFYTIISDDILRIVFPDAASFKKYSQLRAHLSIIIPNILFNNYIYFM